MTTPPKKRGRPPSGKTASELARERKRRQRSRLEESGGKQLNVELDSDGLDALLVCIGAYGKVTVSELVGRLLRAEAAKIRQ